MPLSANEIDRQLERAAACLREADGIIITAGAGMGIDSGLPDFRGENGFWKAYPALGKLRMGFTRIANPEAFDTCPELAWGFYGHRLNLYRATVPHEGFRLLLQLGRSLPGGAGVFTSNVDGQFQKAGFAPGLVTECHGSIHYLQCHAGCTTRVWSAEGFNPQVDNEKCLLLSPLPTCPACGGLARPNILMFGDWGFAGARYEAAEERLLEWIRGLHFPVVIELGAGSAIPSVRYFGQRLACPRIRINPHEFSPDRRGDIGIPLGAREAVERLLALL